MIRLFKNKKAVSNVVSAMMMVLIVMIGMSGVFAYFVNYSRDYQIGAGSSVLESITVEDVWFRTINSETVCDIWVYNFGKIDVTISDIYVENINLGLSERLTIEVGGHGNIILQSSSLSFVQGESYLFKIVTERGTSFEGTYTWW
ncbi:MAG: hypothetical protein IAX21_00380 [Candidatus Bathyarchaeota archaeon]|nr:hypothetical protein [Candidatus Bathyarchaeum tardum]WNZ29363.1 MAG: hypothetical protein IAX21_00380 [Candidatus Bathyarchaeota archaeon]